MRLFKDHLIGVDQGDCVLFSDYETGGEMWTGEGARARRERIRFSRPFLTRPVVQVSITLWDTDRGTNARMDLSAERISPEGFDLVFRTWGDTRVARVRLSWMAIGELPHPDAWDV